MDTWMTEAKMNLWTSVAGKERIYFELNFDKKNFIEKGFKPYHEKFISNAKFYYDINRKTVDCSNLVLDKFPAYNEFIEEIKNFILKKIEEVYEKDANILGKKKEIKMCSIIPENFLEVLKEKFLNISYPIFKKPIDETTRNFKFCKNFDFYESFEDIKLDFENIITKQKFYTTMKDETKNDILKKYLEEEWGNEKIIFDSIDNIRIKSKLLNESKN